MAEAFTNSDGVPRTKRQWARLSHREKEEAWKAKFGFQYDSRFPTKITTAEEALRTFAPYLLSTEYSSRTVPRRGYLAALKGGRCEMDILIAKRPELASLSLCNEKVDDYRFLRMWEFNHIVDRFWNDSQFLISGSSVCRRNWSEVKQHCLQDTVLLCRECHWKVTNLQKEAQIIANRAVYGVPDRVQQSVSIDV